jgi:hypothetical protein
MSKPGYLTPSELTTVQGSMQLANSTARAWETMKAAAAKEGVTLTIAAPGGAYRSHALTLAMRANPKAYNVTPGITPSLTSQHMEGICVDVAQGLAWVKRNGARFGFTFPLSGDPNHARHDGTTAAGTGHPINTKETNMPAVIKRTTGTAEWSLIWPPLRGPSDLERGYIVTTDPTRAKWWTRFYELGQGSEDKFERTDYIEAQENARLDHEAWLAGQTVAPAAQTVDYDKLATALAKALPPAPTFNITGTAAPAK